MSEEPDQHQRRQPPETIQHSQVGDIVDIELDAQSGSGFRWEIDPKTATIVALEESRRIGSNPTTLGSPAPQHFRFRVVRPRTAVLTFHYRRPLEPDPTDVHHTLIAVSPTDARACADDTPA
jgi:predicted secreted protein